jgi:S1-C subfamily serine protease
MNNWTFTTIVKRLLSKLVAWGAMLLIGIGVVLLGCEPAIAQVLPGWADWAIVNPHLLAQVDLDRTFVTEVIDKTESAVVQVNVSRTLGNAPAYFNPFFGGAQGAPPQVVRGIGSGFVISPNGLIITNAHVVADADTVTVSFQNGQILEGKVLGKDPVTDVAVIRVSAENLPTVTIGDSDKVRQGQWAIAIGNPLGLQETVTVGVISGTERSSMAIGIPDKRIGFIQTDAAINPGNSGGPLLNARGEVIGVNTAIIQGTQGLGFAIPINTAQQVAQQLIATGQVQHPYIGMQMVPLDSQVKQYVNSSPNSGMKIDAEQGVLVVQVGKGTPAAKAGLRSGDVIQAVNDQPITKANTLQKLLDETGIGGELQVDVQRGGRTMSLKIRPEQMPTAENRR